MIFKRGSEVEVLTKKKVSSGVWLPAEVVAVNGDSYMVRYYRRPGRASQVAEKVLAEAVRPCPPPVRGAMNWAVGDIIEVLDDGYWKVATIEEVMEGGYYYIRLIGSLEQFRVEKSGIRVRQEWRDNQWALIEKDSESCEDWMLKILRRSPKQRQDDFNVVQEVPESSLLPESLKRSSPYSSSPDEARTENVQKRRAVEECATKTILGDSYSCTGKDMWRHVSLTAHMLTDDVVASHLLFGSRKGHHLHWLLCR